MKYIVTGGAGFIGSNLVDDLLNDNHTVHVIDNFCGGYKKSRINHKATYHDVNLSNQSNFDKIVNILTKSDTVFHMACIARVQPSIIDPVGYEINNSISSAIILKACVDSKVRRFVYSSSSSVYGNNTNLPLKESFGVNPLSPYGAQKFYGEVLCKTYREVYGLETVSLRYFNVYGIGQTIDYAGVITKFYDNIQADKAPIIFGDGSQTRDFISVDDVANANLLAMQSNTDFTHLNIGTGITTSIKQLANLMISLSGKSLEAKFDELPEGDIKESQADVSLAKKMIHWSYETNLENGLSDSFF